MQIQYTIDQPIQPNGTAQNPYIRKFCGLKARPYWEFEDFSEASCRQLKELVRNFAALQREFQIAKAPHRYVDGHTGYHGTMKDWRHRDVVTESMEFPQDARDSFPQLCALLEPFVSSKSLHRSFFAMMRPGVRLPNHCGATNLFLRLHLAMEIPTGDSGLMVGGEVRHWREGEIILFDDSFGHEAWNNCGQDRYILIMRIMHPEVSDIERHWLPIVFDRFKGTDASNDVLRVLQETTMR